MAIERRMVRTYEARLTDHNGATGIELIVDDDVVVYGSGGRRLWNHADNTHRRAELATLTMTEAAALLVSLADKIGFMAAHPE